MSEGVVLTLAPRLLVSVDFWRRARLPLAAHFLTHMHADHTEGLGADWRSPAGGPIYCSPATRQLLQDKWPGLAAPVVPLPVGETTVLRLAPGGGGAVDVSVTPLDACHCLGAVMFLMEGPCGRILHTGDFRWELAAQRAQEWHPALTYAPIDLLLLDNTYCHPRFEAPTRAEAAATVMQLVRAHPRHDIVIGVDSLGKEELLAEIAAALAPGEQLGVAPNRAAALWLAGLDRSLFTPHVSDVRVRVVPRWQLTLERLAKLNRAAPTLGIIASGFGASDTSRPPPAAAAADRGPSRQAVKVQAALGRLRRSSGGGSVAGGSGGVGADENAAERGGKSGGGWRLDLAAYAALLAAVWVPDPTDAALSSLEETQAARQLLQHVPYSLHCTYAELHAFVARLAPRSIRGIVKGSCCTGGGGGGGQAISVAEAVAAAARQRRAAAAGGGATGRVPFACLDPVVHFGELLRPCSASQASAAVSSGNAISSGDAGCGGGGVAGEHSSVAADGAPASLLATARLCSWQDMLQQSGAAQRHLAKAAAAGAGLGSRRRSCIPVPSAACAAEAPGAGAGRDGGGAPCNSEQRLARGSEQACSDFSSGSAAPAAGTAEQTYAGGSCGHGDLAATATAGCRSAPSPLTALAATAAAPSGVTPHLAAAAAAATAELAGGKRSVADRMAPAASKRRLPPRILRSDHDAWSKFVPKRRRKCPVAQAVLTAKASDGKVAVPAVK